MVGLFYTREHGLTITEYLILEVVTTEGDLVLEFSSDWLRWCFVSTLPSYQWWNILTKLQTMEVVVSILVNSSRYAPSDDLFAYLEHTDSCVSVYKPWAGASKATRMNLDLFSESTSDIWKRFLNFLHPINEKLLTEGESLISDPISPIFVNRLKRITRLRAK